MSADREAGKPLLARAMRGFTALLLSYPVATVVVAVLLALASAVLSGTQLGFKTSRSDLLDPNSSYNKLWLDYIAEFGSDEDAVVVVEGESREQVVAALRDISQLVTREDRLFHSVLSHVDPAPLRSKGLYFLSPQELAGVGQFAAEARSIAGGQWTRLKSDNVLTGLSERWRGAAQAGQLQQSAAVLHELQRYTRSLNTFLSGQGYLSPWPEMSLAGQQQSQGDGPEFLLAAEGRVGFVLLKLAKSGEAFTPGTAAIDALREICNRVERTHEQSGINVGLTGIPILENDEMRASQSSMLWSSVISFFAVGLIFIAGFGGIRHAIMANLVLLLGMAWAFAYVTLTVGHLNILSVSFAVTMIGIGIDYGVYYVARYMKARPDAPDCKTALLETTSSVGPAIAAGAVTTAIAFVAAGWTSFPGVAELGIIAGGGILLCAVAQLFVLPAVVMLIDRGRLGERMPRPLGVHRVIAGLMRTPKLVLLVTLAGTLALASGLDRLWYDHNLLNLQAKNQESVELERRLTEKCGQSMWFAISIADTPEELLARKAKFLELESVDRVEEIVSRLPGQTQEKASLVQHIAAMLQTLPAAPDQIPVPSPAELHASVLQTAAAAQQSVPSEAAISTALLHELDAARSMIERMPGQDYYRAVSMFQQTTAGDLLMRLQGLQSVSNPAPPTMDDFPSSLVTRFVGQSGRYLMKVYGRGDIWDIDALAAFVADVRSVDPLATGNPLQAYEATHEMKNSYEQAALYAMIVIFVVLLIDLRSLRYAVLAAVPLGIGVLQTFGLMGLLDIPLNPANVIALPLILGISVDEGVHIIHDYLEQKKGRYRMSASTAIGVLVDALTTIVGFGSLMIASHEGLQSLGRVLALGITCCTFTSMVMLPAFLTLLTWNRADEDEASPDELIQPRSADREEALRAAAADANAEHSLIRPRQVAELSH